MITEDESHRFVTDAEKAKWNNSFVSKFYATGEALPTEMPVGAVIFVEEGHTGLPTA